MGIMRDLPVPEVRFVAPAQAAEVLGVTLEEVVELVERAQLRGARVGSPPRLRIEEASVAEYLDNQIELERRMALWRGANEASFPELWGKGIIRHGD